MTVYGFDGFALDGDRFELRRDGRPLAVEPQVLRVLLHLVEHRDRMITRAELFEAIWKGRFVSDAALSSRIKSARQALGDDGISQRYLKTLRGEGFRFVGEVTVAHGAPTGAPAELAAVMQRPLIGVFPFSSGEGEAAYLVDGLVDMLVAELAAWRWLPVLSRNATRHAAARAVDELDAARALGVRYAVTGRIARSGKSARLAVELMDVSSGQMLMAESFEDAPARLTARQGELATHIFRRIAPEIGGAERRRIVRLPPKDLSAWDLTLKALWALNMPTPGGLDTVLTQLDQSIALDPGEALPWSLKAQTYFEIGLNGWLVGQAEQSLACFSSMLDAARRAIELDPRGWMGHSLASAGELFSASAYAPARFHAEEALRLNPSAGMAHHLSGCIIGFGGDPAAAIEIQQHAFTVDPEYRHSTVIEADLGLWNFLRGDMERALAHLDAALGYNPDNLRALQRRIAVQARMGRPDCAREDVAVLMRHGVSLTPQYVRVSYPFQNAAHGDALLDALFGTGVCAGVWAGR